MRVYRIKTNLTQDESNDLNERIEQYDRNILDEYDDDIYDLDLLIDGKITSFMICHEVAIEIIKGMLKKYEVVHEIDDITEDFLIGKIELESKDFTNFRERMLDVDLVLDKINEMGIESLTDLDRRVLEKESKNKK